MLLKNCNALVFDESLIKYRFKMKDILIKNGKVDKIDDVILKDDSETVIDMKGKYVTPGFVEPHCQVGLNEHGSGIMGKDVDESSEAVNLNCYALDAINMLEKGFEDFRASGITTAGIFPGNNNVIGGFGTVVKCCGSVVDQAVVKKNAGLKVSISNLSKKDSNIKNNAPITRMGITALLKQTIFSSIHDGTDDMKEVIEGKLPIVVYCQRHDDIMTAIRFSKEYNLDYKLVGLADYQTVKTEILKEDKSFVVGPIMRYGDSEETRNRDVYTVLDEADMGSLGSLTTEHPVINGRYIGLQGGIAVQNGLDYYKALECLTINPARFLNIDDQVGSLEVGKDGDIVVWSGLPLEPLTKVEMTFINGDIVFDGGVL